MESPASLVDQLVNLYRLIKMFEGCRLVPYICPAGVWTCGWGSTGPDVIPGRPWTQEYADKRMADDALRFALGVIRLAPGKLEGDRLCAIADFAYNCGLGNFQASTLRRRILADDWGDVPAQLRRWIYGGGRVLPGLVRRREAEIALL
jgi:lysozyme